LETEEDSGRLRIDGIRELNRLNALALQRTVNAVLTDAVKTIELDLSQTAFVDSHGLGALLALGNMMGRRKGAVRLVHPSRVVEQVLEMTRLHRVFDIVKCEEALAGCMNVRLRQFSTVTDRVSESPTPHPLKAAEPATAVTARYQGVGTLLDCYSGHLGPVRNEPPACGSWGSYPGCLTDGILPPGMATRG